MLLQHSIATQRRDKRRQSASQRFSVKADVADLRREDISSLANEDLIEAIRTSHLPCLCTVFENRLNYCDRETLERLTHLARKCCLAQGY